MSGLARSGEPGRAVRSLTLRYCDIRKVKRRVGAVKQSEDEEQMAHGELARSETARITC